MGDFQEGVHRVVLSGEDGGGPQKLQVLVRPERSASDEGKHDVDRSAGAGEGYPVLTGPHQQSGRLLCRAVSGIERDSRPQFRGVFVGFSEALHDVVDCRRLSHPSRHQRLQDILRGASFQVEPDVFGPQDLQQSLGPKWVPLGGNRRPDRPFGHVNRENRVVVEPAREQAGQTAQGGPPRHRSLPLADEGDQILGRGPLIEGAHQVRPFLQVPGFHLHLGRRLVEARRQDIEGLPGGHEHQIESGVVREGLQGAHHVRKALLPLGVGRDGEQQALVGGNGAAGTADYHHLLRLGQELVEHAAKHEAPGRIVALPAHHDRRDPLLGDGPHHAVGHVVVDPRQRNDGDFRVGGVQDSPLEQRLPLRHAGLHVSAVPHYRHRVDRLLRTLRAEQHRQVHELVDRLGIGQGNQNPLRRLRWLVGGLGLRQGHLPPKPLDDPRPDQRSEKDEQHHGVDGGFVEKSHVEPHQRHREGRRRLGRGQAEDRPRLVGAQAVEPLCRPGREALADPDEPGKGQGVEADRPALQQDRRVDEHAHRDEKKRNKQCLPNELDSEHQGTSLGHERIERDADEKRPDDRGQIDEFGEVGGYEHDRQQKDELQIGLLAHRAEEPLAEAGDAIKDEHAVGRHEPHKSEPEEESGLALDRRRHDRQEQQRNRVGDHGPPHRHGDGPVFRDAEPIGHRIGEQGVRPHDGPQQQRRRRRKREDLRAQHVGQSRREEKRQPPERQALPLVADELVQVERQPGREHQVQEPHRAQQLEGGSALEHAQRIGPHHGAAHDEPHQPGHPQPPKQRRGQEHDQHHRGKNQNRIREGPVETHYPKKKRTSGKEMPPLRSKRAPQHSIGLAPWPRSNTPGSPTRTSPVARCGNELTARTANRFDPDGQEPSRPGTLVEAPVGILRAHRPLHQRSIERMGAATADPNRPTAPGATFDGLRSLATP